MDADEEKKTNSFKDKNLICLLPWAGENRFHASFILLRCPVLLINAAFQEGEEDKK